MGDKYFAIPWNAFRFNLAEKHAVLNLDKKQLENAPGFDKDNWPNMADSTWGTNIYKHYVSIELLSPLPAPSSAVMNFPQWARPIGKAGAPQSWPVDSQTIQYRCTC
jgi:hypothetical protein